MTPGSVTALIAAILSLLLAITVVLARRTVPAWFFAAGMILLGFDSLLGSASLNETDPEKMGQWHTWQLITKSLLPFTWLAFSQTYLRGDYLRNLFQWRWPLLAALLIPAGLALGFRSSLVAMIPREGGGWWIAYGFPALLLNVVLLIATILVLTNLEKTLRAAVGTARWKVKFAMLGLGLIFGAGVYSRSQTLLFSGFELHLTVVESSALLIGCLLMTVSLVRQGFGGIDVYPSRALLQGSVTIVLVGGYLFLIGVLAQLAAYFGGTENFQFQALVILAGVAALALLLLSDRLRLRLRSFVSRHFRRPQHDALALWTAFIHRLSSVSGTRYGTEAVKLIAETFQTLSVTLWLHDEGEEALVLVASTGETAAGPAEQTGHLAPAAPILAGLYEAAGPLDLDGKNRPAWAESLSEASPSHFNKGGGRLCIPLVAGGRAIGALILVDRVNGVSYSAEDLDILKCIGDQVAAGLLQLQLTDELMQGKEMEAFQVMATFFVHDLKNAANSLGLMLKNLPVHFDNPEFRKDALRGIGSTVGRINQIIGRLGSLRQKLELKPSVTDLNRLVTEAIEGAGFAGGIEIIRDLQPIPPVMADQEQLNTVLTNLLLNAAEAMERGGRIEVRTCVQENRAVLSVTDTGCGMTPAFIRDYLFRPFHTTKKKGLGIGMFQCRMIINAHGGALQVESEPGRGTTFHILLPLKIKAP